jgi:predicted DNA binding CopG/RHH family protein
MRKEYDLKRLKKRDGAVKVDAHAAKHPISIRIDGSILASLKTEAARLGIPYQTFIGSLLHRYANGELIDRQVVKSAEKLRIGGADRRKIG